VEDVEESSLQKKRLPIEYSPPDPPSARNHVPVGTGAQTCTNRHVLRAKGGPGRAIGC
jgi:hypothetical protein